MADLFVAKELKTYLVAQGVGIHPPTTGAAVQPQPSIWLPPRDGAPQPRWVGPNPGDYTEPATITLVEQDTAAPMGVLDAYEEETFVDVVVRALSEPAAKLIHRQIRGLLHPIGATHGKQLWSMNDLLVQLSTTWRSERPSGVTPVDYSRTASYRFRCRRKSLAGMSYVP